MPQLRVPTILATALTLAFLTAPPAAGDWLVTLRGELIETAGSWIVDGETVTYIDSTGVERTLAVKQVDLEGSEEATTLKGGWAETAAAEEPRIVLYMTSWCGYCRKARKLLTQLGADFVAKDIEKSPEAAREYSAKSGGRGGVPLIDFDGKIVRGYSDRTIRKLVRELRDKYGDA